ncbi:MAG: bifunctional biotin--[acetyl-CoA-carboxylase] ligase/biotin operon repressor BirA [Methylotenera sp.]|uniref:bifunctional biotin--[acetyl-CoA-carboxylase] ligase/biotin operon repressor BirA n=1 Tax=Methylotenera sp. TaxID=2051956 RepID=UPI002726BEF1|nr:bifunctional biotin--[acetyl-CoA-carboxylase] ligase/biotin operon repressor BirA [Methylotenera sp.]MDO9149835.1 bifunctional biotin--[acetyl-CoA-carboxylase] ligase/biotin operon repressor BirA [Methylotenera sp.]
MMNSLTFPILKLLADGKFHSGEAIAQHFNVSRATVWNAIQHAESLGIEVFSVRGRGYKLPQTLTLIDKQSIVNKMSPQLNWLNVEVFDTMPSTNSYLMQNMGAKTHGTCVVTNLQTSGRGRRGREWQASLGASLTFSLLWRFQCGAATLSGLSLAVGVALIRSLHELGATEAKLKWPNDILINQKKLAGILIELQGDMEGPSTAVIGVGINLQLPESVLQKIDQPATDLHQTLAHTINSNALMATLLKHLVDVLLTFEKTGFDELRDEWTAHHAYHQQPVRMLMPDGSEVTGVVQAISENGSLMIETTNGMQKFMSGEISLRSYNTTQA